MAADNRNRQARHAPNHFVRTQFFRRKIVARENPRFCDPGLEGGAPFIDRDRAIMPEQVFQAGRGNLLFPGRGRRSHQRRQRLGPGPEPAGQTSHAEPQHPPGQRRQTRRFQRQRTERIVHQPRQASQSLPARQRSHQFGRDMAGVAERAARAWLVRVQHHHARASPLQSAGAGHADHAGPDHGDGRRPVARLGHQTSWNPPRSGSRWLTKIVFSPVIRAQPPIEGTIAA